MNKDKKQKEKNKKTNVIGFIFFIFLLSRDVLNETNHATQPLKILNENLTVPKKKIYFKCFKLSHNSRSPIQFKFLSSSYICFYLIIQTHNKTIIQLVFTFKFKLKSYLKELITNEI